MIKKACPKPCSFVELYSTTNYDDIGWIETPQMHHKLVTGTRLCNVTSIFRHGSIWRWCSLIQVKWRTRWGKGYAGDKIPWVVIAGNCGKGKVGKAERIHLDRTKKWMIHLLPIHNEWRIMNDLMICDDWGWQRDSFTTFTQLAAWDRGTDRPAKFCRVEGFRA